MPLSPSWWAVFGLTVLVLLALDLGVFHRRPHAMTYSQALRASLSWIAVAFLFNAGVWFWLGREKALEFLTGYLIEKALSVDNIFVFLVIFHFFQTPAELQYRVLFWGVLGAIFMRGIFIFLGVVLLEKFHWVIYVFGAFLVLVGIKMLAHPRDTPHPERNAVFLLVRRVIPVIPRYHEGRFLVTVDGKRYATMLLLTLACVEATDLVFAIDSIPAIFAVTRDPFIVYTSNVFAILGLRALYFLLQDAVGRFVYLKIGLGFILSFVGVKMLFSEVYPLPIGVSLSIVGGILAVSLLASFLRTRGRALERLKPPR